MQTIRVLDAVACILVKEANNQVFAVGAQVVPPRPRKLGSDSESRRKGVLKLYVPSDEDEILPSTVEYLEDVWRVLRRIARDQRGKEAQQFYAGNRQRWRR